jgi:hypothetical protein
MNTLKMKIVGFDENSKSLLVSFASDETAHSDPSHYPPLAYQPAVMWPDITDPDEIKRRIAASGIYIADQQRLKEWIDADPTRTDALRDMVGQEETYAVSDLINVPGSDEVNDIVEL